jgi:hypothetical protein
MDSHQAGVQLHLMNKIRCYLCEFRKSTFGWLLHESRSQEIPTNVLRWMVCFFVRNRKFSENLGCRSSGRWPTLAWANVQEFEEHFMHKGGKM